MRMMREVLERLNFNEAKATDIMNLATDKSKDSKITDELRELVKEELKIETKNMPPKTNAKTPEKLTKFVNGLLSKADPATLKIFNNIQGGAVGRGELLLAVISDNVIIGGTSQNYDVDFWNDQIEVKEVRINSGGYGTNFRLGVDSTYLLKKAYGDLVDLYEVARHYIPEINNDDFSDNVHKKGGIALSELRNWKIPKDVEVKEVNLKIQRDGYVLNDGNIVGNLKDKDIIRNIKKIFTVPKNVKSFEQIERELEKGLDGHDMKYFFFGRSKGGISLFYKEKIGDIRIESATSNKVKFQIKLK